MKIERKARILFDGDSITDAGRDRADEHSLSGYNRIIADRIGAERCYNRAVSGERTTELLARWERTLDETRPDYVSILIGINDVWRKYDSNNPTSHEKFKENYETILRTVCPRVKGVILLEPYLIPVLPEREIMREDLNPKIDVIRALARKYRTAYVPLNGLYAEASITGDPKDYSDDSVHPNTGGHAFIAAEWLKHVEIAD